MNLGLIITARCNAACAHCTTSCGPQKTQALSREEIFSLMDQAQALRESPQEPLNFFLSGGEPFLDFPLLLEIVAHARTLHGKTSCVTNGYWAASDAQARAKLGALRAAGLDLLAVSTSRFHQQFVNVSRVERALAIAREFGIRTSLKCALTASDRKAGLDAWARAAGADDLELFPVVPWLREGAALPEPEYIRTPGLPEGRCPVPVITVREDGAAYTCCIPGGFTEFLALGNVADASLHAIENRFLTQGRQQILRQHGPVYFARDIIAKGQGHLLREAYAGVCDLCAHIATDSRLAALAADAARELEQQQVQELFSDVLAATPS